MPSPLLSRAATAPLRAVDEASMPHRAFRGVVAKVRGPGGQYSETVTYPGLGVKARLNPASEDQRQQADQPAATQVWNLAVPSGTPITAGEQWKVTGETNGESWMRDVSVVRVVFPKSQESRRKALCVDIVSNP